MAEEREREREVCTWKKPRSLPASRTARRTSSRGADRSMTGSATAAAEAGGRWSGAKTKLSGSASWCAAEERRFSMDRDGLLTNRARGSEDQDERARLGKVRAGPAGRQTGDNHEEHEEQGGRLHLSSSSPFRWLPHFYWEKCFGPHNGPRLSLLLLVSNPQMG